MRLKTPSRHIYDNLDVLLQSAIRFSRYKKTRIEIRRGIPSFSKRVRRSFPYTFIIARNLFGSSPFCSRYGNFFNPLVQRWQIATLQYGVIQQAT